MRFGVIHVFTSLPKSELGRVLGHQLVRSGTSVGAHCREAFRARSDAEMISKLEVATQELDETMYWIELLVDSDIMRAARVAALMTEADEIMAILITSIKTIKKRKSR